MGTGWERRQCREITPNKLVSFLTVCGYPGWLIPWPVQLEYPQPLKNMVSVSVTVQEKTLTFPLLFLAMKYPLNP